MVDLIDERVLISSPRSSKAVAVWLLIGVGMITIQVLLGGITRLTESGLSITEWKPLTGILPPLNQLDWQIEFDKYKHTEQYYYIHSDFSINDFKFIFFWEWFHRLWARLLGVVFLVGFFYFLATKQFRKNMILQLSILFLLGALQGVIGWIMVKSGLIPERIFVGHLQLTTHFIAAMILLCYTFWVALTLLIPKEKYVINRSLKNLSLAILFLISIQLVYGAFMAGLKAATAAPTWPDINGSMIPSFQNGFSPWYKNLIYNKITVQFIHRTIAYILAMLILQWSLKANKIKFGELLLKSKWLPVFLVFIQVLLGILTVIRSPYGQELVYFGVAHQFVGICLLMSVIWMLFLVRTARGTSN